MLNRSARAALSFLNTLLYQLANAFIGLFITPLIVANLGTDVFGAWKIIDKTTGFLGLGNCKPLGFLQLSLAKNISNEDNVYKQQLIGAATAILILTLPIMLVLSYLLFIFRNTFIPVSGEISYQIDLTLVLMLFYTIISPFCLIPDYIVRGLNMQYLRFGLSSTTAVIAALLQYTVVAQGYTLPWFAVVLYIPIFAIALVNYIILVKNVPWIKLIWPSVTVIRLFFKQNMWMLLIELFRYVLSLADLILIGIYFGATVVAIYSLTKSLISFLLMPVDSLVSATLSGIGDLIGRKEIKRLLQLRSEQINAAIFLAFIIGMIVIFFNHSFVRLWVDEKHFAGENLSRWFIIAAVIEILAKIEANYIDASLKLKKQAFCLGTVAVIYMLTVVLCEPILHLNVIPIAQAVSQTVLIMLYWTRFKDCLQSKLSNLARTVLRPLSIAIVLGWSVSWIQLPVIYSWIDLFFQAFKIAILASILGWFLILQKNDRKKLMLRLVNVFEYRKIKC